MPKKELLFTLSKKDFEIKAFQAGGPGGQSQNKTSSAIRVTHLESGATGESRSERSQLENRKLAFERLAKSAKFRMWVNQKAMAIIEGKTIEQKVEEQMNSKNLLVEVVGEDGEWQKMDEEG